MFRIRTLMIVVLLVALDRAGLVYGPPAICVLCLFATATAPILLFFGAIARKIGINALFR